MKISEHFSREEFACKCGCGFAAVDIELLSILELIRNELDKPVIITSACRCEKHNHAVGGRDGSYHKKGLAVDFQVKGMSATSVYTLVDGMLGDKFGIGSYDNFVHLDVRSKKARW